MPPFGAATPRAPASALDAQIKCGQLLWSNYNLKFQHVGRPGSRSAAGGRAWAVAQPRLCRPDGPSALNFAASK